MKYTMNWDLESIFPGGSASPALKEKINLMTEQIIDYTAEVTSWNPQLDQPTYTHLKTILEKEEKIKYGLTQSFSFINAVQSANVKDTQSGAIFGQLFELNSQFATSETIFIKKMVEIPDEEWQKLIALPDFSPIKFNLSENRQHGKELLSEAEEALINALSIDGFEAWSKHYDTLVGTIEIPFEEKDGTTTLLSAGQAFNKMTGDPDPLVRDQLFSQWEATWSKLAPVFADTLNHKNPRSHITPPNHTMYFKEGVPLLRNCLVRRKWQRGRCVPRISQRNQINVPLGKPVSL